LKRISYDQLNRQISQTDALGNVTGTIYDADNNVVATIDALGYATSYGYLCMRQPQVVGNRQDFQPLLALAA
jgi:RHS Repeat